MPGQEKQRGANVKCSAPNCTREASYEVILYDFYMEVGDVFFERDVTCPFLCEEHTIENERNAQTWREHERAGEVMSIGELLETADDLVSAGNARAYRGAYRYLYTNRDGAQGFTIYRPVK